MPDGMGREPFGFFSVQEALALVAYGDPAALDHPTALERDMLGRWGIGQGWWTEGRRTPPLMRLRWVRARVRWRLTRGGRRVRWRRCPLPPLPREERAQVRHLLRKHRRPAHELIAELRTDVERARLAAEEREQRLRDADRKLCGAIAEGAVTLLGRRGFAEGKGSFFPGVHEPVPAETFLNERRTFLWAWGWAALHCNHPVPWDEWLHHRVSRDDPDWGDLRFPKTAFLARFGAPLTATGPCAGTGAPGRPSSIHLVHPEHARRLKTGEALTRVSDEAEHLAAWFKKAHSSLQPPTAKTIENAIRSVHRERRADPPK